MAWISGQCGSEPDESPVLVASRLHRWTTYPSYGRNPPVGGFINSKVEIGDPSNFPSLWALASLDFDEAVGLLAVGNTFGELVLCDYVGSPLDDLARISDDFTEREALSLHVMPQVRTLS